jgi:HD-GYP domain-containing protein (c-di-GMP phosphodiesterase class II)
VPNSILDKPGKLDADEWSVMREHPALTASILRRVKQFHELAAIAGAHHEKLDGSGYPNQLRADDLPLEARILTVADMYGALIEDRPYRAGFSHEQAVEIMMRDGAGKLDADCFAALPKAAEVLSLKASAAVPAKPILVPPTLKHSSGRTAPANSGPSASIVR